MAKFQIELSNFGHLNNDKSRSTTFRKTVFLDWYIVAGKLFVQTKNYMNMKTIMSTKNKYDLIHNLSSAKPKHIVSSVHTSASTPVVGNGRL